jgi:plastocyanin
MTHRLSALTLSALLALTLALAGCTDASQVEPTGTARRSASAASDAPASDMPASEAPASETPVSEEPDAAQAEVLIEEPDFIPEVLTVTVGTEVTWVNGDSYAHTVTEGTGGIPVDDPIVDEDIAADGTVSLTFGEPGTYDVTCRIHPTMQMTIVVEN